MSALSASDLLVEIAAPPVVSAEERAAILDNCARAGLSFYRAAGADRADVAQIWRALGMRSADRTPESDDDGICRIAVVEGARYIPYTAAALSWHTDGYYGVRAVRSFAMHCVRPAARGGENGYFRPETLYRLLEDESPTHVEALSRDDAMTIPANIDDEREVRAETSAPVFSFDGDGRLHTRWTERGRNIRWRDAEAEAARDACRRILREADEHRIDARLNADEGVVCNNVVHCRTAFEDDPAAPRLLYRGRYYERVGERVGAAMQVRDTDYGLPG